MTPDWMDGLSEEEVREVYARVSRVTGPSDAQAVQNIIEWSADSVRQEVRAKILERAISFSLLRPWHVVFQTLQRPIAVSFDAPMTCVEIERREFTNRTLLEAAHKGVLTAGELAVIERELERQRERAA